MRVKALVPSLTNNSTLFFERTCIPHLFLMFVLLSLLKQEILQSLGCLLKSFIGISNAALVTSSQRHTETYVRLEGSRTFMAQVLIL
ncbi:unnamed protein product [Moneuplotes crassus]|uniref:Uncharacterized protein n=1 Tax=Euplotes crassus TaxID=5936 RepID=A0AAD2D0B2_EUPCR|nr:unnamed protein product [Moneuplotes crassus]